jgi:tetratricopeptide (TPR) repeat protein
MKHLFLVLSTFLITSSLFAQQKGSESAKLDFLIYPTLPVEGVSKIGVQVYTADLPFDRDTLRLYLGNMDVMKSGGERLSKVKYQSVLETNIVDGGGDILIKMAFGKPNIQSKQLKDAPCLIEKEGCLQYYYQVNYSLPAVVQASNSSGVLETWELDSDITVKFGNEQVETHENTEGGSTTSISIISFGSKAALDDAFEAYSESWLVRKALVVQLGRLAESMYPKLFFLEDKLKFDIAYGKGKAADYSETVKAAEDAVLYLENHTFHSLVEPIAVWESWLEKTNLEDKKSAVNKKVAKGFYENLAVAYTFTGDYGKARSNLDKTLELAQSGFVNQPEVDRLKEFHDFIDDLEQSLANNVDPNIAVMATAPDLKRKFGNRKANKDLNFLIAEDKYDEFIGATASGHGSGDMSLAEALEAAKESGSSVSYAERVQEGLLILSFLFDKDLEGKDLPESICELELTTLNARNLGLTGVPDCIGELSLLEKLNLNGNSISTLPESIGNLIGLTHLNISDNQLTMLPEGIYGLTSLKKIVVSDNNLGPDVMQKLSERLPDCKIK